MARLPSQMSPSQCPPCSTKASLSSQENRRVPSSIERLSPEIAGMIISYLSPTEQIFFGLSSPYLYYLVPVEKYSEICCYPRRSSGIYEGYLPRLEVVLREAMEAWRVQRVALWLAAHMLLLNTPSLVSDGFQVLLRHQNAIERILCVGDRRPYGLRTKEEIEPSLRMGWRCERLLVKDKILELRGETSDIHLDKLYHEAQN